MPIARRLGAAVLAALLVAPPAEAASSLGALTDLLLLGAEAGWEGSVQGDAYVLTNRELQDGVEYVYLPLQPEQAGRRSVAVTVSVEAHGRGAGAGLLLAYRPDPRLYHALLLEADGAVSLYRRGPDGLERLGSVALDAVGATALRVVEAGGGFEVHVNGERRMELDGETADKGAVGIIAKGMGRFTFRDFVHEVRPQPLPRAPIVQAQPPIAQPEPQPAPIPVPPPLLAEDVGGQAGVDAILSYVGQMSQQPGHGGFGPPGEPPPGWRRTHALASGQISLDHPEGWDANAMSQALGPGVIGYAHARATSPDRYHLFEGQTSLRQDFVSVGPYAEQVVQHYGGPMGVRRIIREDQWFTSPQAGMPGMANRLDWHVKAVEAGDYVVMVIAVVSATSMTGTALSVAAHRVLIGPARQFDEQAQTLFMPMLASAAHW